MQSKTLQAFALAVGLSENGTFDHKPEILESCPNLQDGAVPTYVIKNDISFNLQDYRTFQHLGDVTQETALTIRNGLLVTNGNSDYGYPNMIMVNSGGDSEARYMITDSMNVAGSTYTVCANQASSAAMTVLANGTKRYAMENCYGIAHSIRGTYAEGTPYELIEFAKDMIKDDEKNRKIITKSSLIDDNCYAALFYHTNGNTKLSSHDMLSLGIVDAILLSDEKMEVRADDPRIKFQACMGDQLADTGTTREVPEHPDVIQDMQEHAFQKCKYHLGF